MKASLVRSGLSALVAALLLVGAAAAQQSAPQGAGALADVAGMELLPVLQRATDAGPADPGQPLVVAVSLPFARPSDVQAFADEVSDPDSPRYRQFLTPEEVGNRFGLPLSRVGEIEDYLRLHGFTITGTGGNRLAVVARGTVGQAEQAFHTTIRKWTAAPQHAIEPAEFIAPSTPVRLPAALADSVIDVCGLDTFTRPLPLATLLTPALARSLYDTKPIYDAGMTGAGRTIGISSFDGFRESNWLLFISHFALPVPAGGPGSNVTDVLVGGGGTGAGGAGGEGDLDIQMALGQAPLADIRIYDSPSKSNLIAVLSAEANDNLCDVITESYGWQLPTGTANSAHNQHLSMTAQGITYMAASGDFGTTIEPFSYPDYDPEVLSVGGTIANVNVTTGARVTEKNWTGGGSGWSNKALAFNVRPSWQTGVGVPAINAENDRRLVPDVAFHSSGNSGAYQFYVNNGLNAGIGTSFASPVFAGQLQLISQKVIALGGLQPDGSGKRRFGRMQDLIYAQNNDPAIWFDITTGNSNGPLPSDQGLATPHVGWDSCVGWGPMNCDAFASAVVCATGGCGDVGWTDLGFALAGINGLPALTAAGPMTAGSETSMTLTQARPVSFADLVVSMSQMPTPFKGGTLVPVPAAVSVNLLTDGVGSIQLVWPAWPAAVPAGTTLFFQYAIQDAAAPKGVSLSNALQALTP